jgi:hypothetical protein
MKQNRLLIKTNKKEELVVGHVHFPMFNDKISGTYAQYTYDASLGGRPLIGSLLKNDVESISLRPVKEPIELLEHILENLEILINSEPTGETRNMLCDINIKLMSLKLSKKLTEKA